MSKATEQSVKQRLKAIAKKEGVLFNSLLKTLFLERFLVRIGKSEYKDNLIFKGGMCLAQFIKLDRETKDIDFLLDKLNGSIPQIEKMMKEIAAIDAGDDFTFSVGNLSELSLEHKKYPGYRINIDGQLGQTREKVSIDIGVGDVVRPSYLEVELIRGKKPIFEENIELNAYPPEYIFSEKLEAILYHGEVNSRMKDYYDCYRMIEDKALDENLLKEALKETTANRGTELTLIPDDVEPFSQIWSNFIRANKFEDLKLSGVVETINAKLKTII